MQNARNWLNKGGQKPHVSGEVQRGDRPCVLFMSPFHAALTPAIAPPLRTKFPKISLTGSSTLPQT